MGHASDSGYTKGPSLTLMNQHLTALLTETFPGKSISSNVHFLSPPETFLASSSSDT